jgi:hypothetical protein
MLRMDGVYEQGCEPKGNGAQANCKGLEKNLNFRSHADLKDEIVTYTIQG